MFDDPPQGRLRQPAGAHQAGTEALATGPVHVDGRRAGLLYVPTAGASRLMIVLHGAGGQAEHGVRLLADRAEEYRLMLFAPQSAGRTWDVIMGGYGPDVARIQRALDSILAGHPLAESKLVVGGFSDGASYALSLGLINGDIVDAVVAFSPGFVAPGNRLGRPPCFVSHGRADRVLPIDRCSRRIVPALRRAGYPVEYCEFDGGHDVPPAVIDDAMTWLSALGDRPVTST